MRLTEYKGLNSGFEIAIKTVVFFLKSKTEDILKSCYLGTRRYQGGIAMSFFLCPNGLLSKKSITRQRVIPAI